MHARTSVALTCPSATHRRLSMGISNPSTAAAAARRFEVAAVCFPGIAIIPSWVPGVLEAKSWGTHIRLGNTTVGDACRTMLILAVLLLCFSCYTLLLLLIELRTTTNSSAAGCRCLSVAAVAPR